MHFEQTADSDAISIYQVSLVVFGYHANIWFILVVYT